MPLYLIRHADAVPAIDDDDAARSLSPRGHAEVSRVAAFFRANRQLTPSVIGHSPLVRARQTAEGLRHGLGLNNVELREIADACPEDDPQRIFANIGRQRLRESFALVGHEPHLAALATLLIGGSAESPVFHLSKAAVLCFEQTLGLTWILRWHVSPDLLPSS